MLFTNQLQSLEMIICEKTINLLSEKKTIIKMQVKKPEKSSMPKQD